MPEPSWRMARSRGVSLETHAQHVVAERRLCAAPQLLHPWRRSALVLCLSSLPLLALAGCGAEAGGEEDAEDAASGADGQSSPDATTLDARAADAHAEARSDAVVDGTTAGDASAAPSDATSDVVADVESRDLGDASADVAPGPDGGADDAAADAGKDAGPACAPDQTLCASGCKDLQSDDLSCGTCGFACAPGSACTAATCVWLDPDTFAPGDVDVVTVIRTEMDRKEISPLIYGLNGNAADSFPAALLASVTLMRRGGDRGNSYNWETNVSNGTYNNNYSNDMLLAAGLANQSAPAGQDLARLAQNRPAGRATLVPFVLNDFVSGPVSANIPYDQAGWNRTQYFNKVAFTKPTPYAASPDLADGTVYTDEHLSYMMSKYADDITAPGPGRLIVGIDNEPDLYHFNFPMLQAGSGEPLYAANGQQIGTRVTGPEFTQRVIAFTKRVRQIAPNAHIVGPDHYGYDGFTTWHEVSPSWSDKGHWYMDDFLADMKAASAVAGTRLIDTWDFHWYPQAVYNGVFQSQLDDASRKMTQQEIDAVVQGPRSYWDTTYDEGSWITSAAHLGGPVYVLSRVQARLDAGWPGTKVGVTEYFPGGRSHISSGLAVADTLGVFQRMGVEMAAMWPLGSDMSRLAYAFGGMQLLRNADGNGLRFADTAVRVEHPEKVQTSVYAGSDMPSRLTVLVVNKTSAVRRVGLRAYNPGLLATVDVYRIDASHPAPFHAQHDALVKSNAYAYAAPPMSATMLVFQAP